MTEVEVQRWFSIHIPSAAVPACRPVLVFDVDLDEGTTCDHNAQRTFAARGRHIVSALARLNRSRPPLPSIPAIDPVGQGHVAAYQVKHYGTPGLA